MWPTARAPNGGANASLASATMGSAKSVETRNPHIDRGGDRRADQIFPQQHSVDLKIKRRLRKKRGKKNKHSVNGERMLDLHKCSEKMRRKAIKLCKCSGSVK